MFFFKVVNLQIQNYDMKFWNKLCAIVLFLTFFSFVAQAQSSAYIKFNYKNSLLKIVIIATLVMLALVLYVPYFASFFKISSLNGMQIGWAIATSFISVIWFEIYKWRKRKTGSGNV